MTATKNFLVRIAVAATLLAATAGSVQADGMLVPVRDDLPVRGEWAVKYHRVKIHVSDQVAQVQIDQAFVNVGKTPIEVQYLFPVPPGAGIDKMTIIADGKELTGKLLNADQARKIYEQIVSKKKDPALLEYVGYGLYKTSVFPLPPGEQRQVLIHYTTECKKDRDLVTIHYPLNTEKFSAKAIDEVSVTVDIAARGDIGVVYSPTHELKVQRKAPNRVLAEYHVENAIPATDFQVLYQTASNEIGATVISHRSDKHRDGYLMVLISPTFGADRPKAVSKDIVFVLDRSGSMSGQKIAQAKQSLAWIVKNLNAEDRFNVVSFSDSAERFFNIDLVPADAEHVENAADLVEGIEAGGGTNVKDALTTALSLLPTDSDRPGYVVFITDGQPTVGVTDERGILKATAETNRRRARLFCLGVGYDVNVRLLDKLSKDNRGLSDYVKENEPLEAKVSGLYAKISHPVMIDLKVAVDGAKVGHMYPQEIGDLFHGQQLVLVGRYGVGGRHQLVLNGRYMGKEKVFEYPVELDTFSEDNSAAYLPRVWAMRRVGFLMDQIALNGEHKELIDELITLSRDYGIMTPYTSFLAEEDTNLGDVAALRKAGERFDLAGRLHVSSGDAGQRNAMVRQMLGQAVAAPSPSMPAGSSSKDWRFASAMTGNTNRADYEAARVETVANVRQVGNSTLYRRANQWYTPDLAGIDIKADAADIRTIKQFEVDYFALAAVNTPQENQLLAAQGPDEELLVRLRGQVYRILPARR
ncbi:MAG: VWA domain-containing protein [Planctomycetes bacterium]|nr:VWA domain-containing protein [Planctomycetota bacterium]